MNPKKTQQTYALWYEHWVNLQKSELTPQQRIDYIGYCFFALVRPTDIRWNKIQDTFNRISKKSVISARTLIFTIGLLTSRKKTVKLGSIHMRPFQWHLKVHWKFPMPLNSPIPWTQKMKWHSEWWLNPQHVLFGEFLNPRDKTILIFTPQRQVGTHTKIMFFMGGLWSHKEKQLHINPWN